MKYLLFHSITGFLLLFPQISFSQNHSLNYYKSYFKNQLKDWTKSYNNFQLSNFTISDSIYFDNLSFGDIKELKKFYKIYKPALSFSPDNNQFIDIYSYQLNLEWKGEKLVANIEVDGAVSLCNLKLKKWMRIYFCGASSAIEDAIWVSNSKFILVGYEHDEDNRFLPMILIGNPLKKIFYVYKNNNKNCFGKKDGYISSKIKALKFEEE